MFVLFVYFILPVKFEITKQQLVIIHYSEIYQVNNSGPMGSFIWYVVVCTDRFLSGDNTFLSLLYTYRSIHEGFLLDHTE